MFFDISTKLLKMIKIAPPNIGRAYKAQRADFLAVMSAKYACISSGRIS